MINDDVLIKIARSRGFKYTWPEQVIRMKSKITEMKIGFPGIGNDHLSLVTFKEIKNGDIFIVDENFEYDNSTDNAPLMLKKLDTNKYMIEAIGCGLDSVRDPERIKFRWKDVLEVDNLLNPEYLVFRLDARPKYLIGGPAYYFFYKSYRDNRL